MPDHPAPSANEPPSVQTLGGCLVILFAKMIGYGIVLTCALVIARQRPWQFSLADVLFWLSAVAIPLVQQLAWTRYERTAGDTKPRSPVGRFAAHIGLAAVLWVVVQSTNILP